MGRSARSVLIRILPLEALSEPPVALVLLGLLFALAACHAVLLPIVDTDIWWLGAAGRDTLASGHVPHVNGYSFTDPNHPWVMHEWLYGVVVARGAALFGPPFFALVGALAGTITMFLGVAFCAAYARRPAATLVAALLALGPIAAFCGPRPMVATLWLPLAVMHLAFRPGWSRSRSAGAIAMVWLWTQLHGSFLLGIALLVVAAVSESADRKERSSRLIAALGALVVTLLNPYGIHLHGLVQHYVMGDDDVGRLIHSAVAEFQPLWAAGPEYANPFILAELAIALALAISALVHRRHRVRALFAIFFVALAVHQARNAALAILLSPLLLLPEIDDLLATLDLAASPAPHPWRSSLVTVAPGFLIAIALWSHSLKSRAAEDWIDPSIAPVLTLAPKLPDNAHVYVTFRSSAFFIWLTEARGVRVFFDSRNDCYSADVLTTFSWLNNPLDQNDFAKLQNAGQLLVDRGTEWIVVPRTEPLFTVISRSPLWSSVSSAGNWTMFHHDAELSAPH